MMAFPSNPSLATDDEITIRRAESVADYQACQSAQRQAWGIHDDGYVVPVATMVGANLHGGLVIGAFLPTGEAVAISFAFLGRIEGRLCQYSQLTGVVPGYQSRGLGYRIKMVQRDMARADGIECIAWAFDPLQAGNAHFNLNRLGATAARYVTNMYGARTDTLNASVPTDRLIAEWDITGEHSVTTDADTAANPPRLIETAESGDSRLKPLVVRRERLGLDSRLWLEIPRDIATMRRDEPGLAESWRVAVGEAFRAAFEAGFRATQFSRDEPSGPPRGFYVLERVQFKS